MRFTVNQEAGRISALADEVGVRLAGIGIAKQTITDVNLCLEELVVNSIEHGMRGREAFEIFVDIEVVDEGLLIEIVDDAEPFDPTVAAPTPDLDAAMADRPVGGLGLYLVSCLAEAICHRREDGRNRLGLVMGIAVGDDGP